MVARMAEVGQSCDEALHEEEEGCPNQDALAEIDLWGISPCRWYDGSDGQDATIADWMFPGGCGSVFGPCGTCGSLQEAKGKGVSSRDNLLISAKILVGNAVSSGHQAKAVSSSSELVVKRK